MPLKLIKATLFSSFLLIPLICFGDEFFLINKVSYGRIVKISDQVLSFKIGCDSEEISEVLLSEIEYISINDKCTINDVQLNPTRFGSGVSAPCDNSQKLLKVIFQSKSGKLFAYARAVSFRDSQASIELINNNSIYEGPRNEIIKIEPLATCTTNKALLENPPIPGSFIEKTSH